MTVFNSTAGLSVPPSAALGWQGAVRLAYDRLGPKTRLASAWHQAPLKLQRPFYPESESICHTVLIHTAGGMVAGDRLDYRVALGSDAHAVLTTAAASKVYGMAAPTAQQTLSQQMLTFDLAAGACLEWLPQETIVFDQAQLLQFTRVNLAVGAKWLGWDIYRLGRTARGERFSQGQWRSRTEVWQAGKPLWIDRQWLRGGEMLSHPHSLKDYPVIGTLAWLGQPLEPEFIQSLRMLATDAGVLGETGVTRLQQGCLCRYRGPSTAEVRQWFTQVWHHVRSYALGQPACSMRIWQL